MLTAFQMDHPSRLNAATDTTFMLIEEAQKRGHQCFFFEPKDLSWHDGEVLARLAPLSLNGADWKLGDAQTQSLNDMGVVWMRQDPPFNMRYITATHLLEHVAQNTRVVNDPAGVRNAPEKLSVLHLEQYMPPTLVSLDAALIAEFAAEHGTIVGKPLHGYGGRSVYKFDAADGNIATLIEHWGESVGEPLMWQAYLPEVKTADLRVLLIDGEIRAAFQREPQGNSIRANMRVGGIAKQATLSEKQTEIVTAIGPLLKEQGLLLVGLDLIGDSLTEINVTSPTGLRAAQQLYGVNLAAELWNRLS